MSSKHSFSTKTHFNIVSWQPNATRSQFLCEWKSYTHINIVGWHKGAKKMVANDFFGHYDAPQLTSTKFLGTKTPQYGVKAQRYVTEPPQIHSSSGMCLSTNNESLHIGDAHWNGLHFHNAWGTPLEKLQKILKTSSLIDKEICKYATTWLQKRKYMGSTVFPWNQEPKRLWQITTFAVKWIMFRFVFTK